MYVRIQLYVKVPNMTFISLAYQPIRSAVMLYVLFFFSSRRRHTSWPRDWNSDVCSSDLGGDSLFVGLYPASESAHLGKPIAELIQLLAQVLQLLLLSLHCIEAFFQFSDRCLHLRHRVIEVIQGATRGVGVAANTFQIFFERRDLLPVGGDIATIGIVRDSPKFANFGIRPLQFGLYRLDRTHRFIVGHVQAALQIGKTRLRLHQLLLGHVELPAQISAASHSD